MPRREAGIKRVFGVLLTFQQIKNACSTLLSVTNMFSLLSFQSTDGADIFSRLVHFKRLYLMLIWSCGVSSESPRSFILVKLIIETS